MMAQSWSQRCLIEGAREAHCGAMMDQSWSQRCLIVGEAHCGAMMAQSWSQRCLIEGAREAHCGAMMDQSWSQRFPYFGSSEKLIVKPRCLKVGAKGASLWELERLIVEP
jgi:diadenosine tetraphosphatase ApaH/serine/threonine PP2A family protein phosphatase